jgi:hypothetical protein
MRRYHTVDVSEAQLEDLVRQAPELVETGLKFVDHQRRTTDGRLDVLLVDSGQALVIAELKVVEDDGMLFQALDYYDYISSNLESLARVYKAFNVDPEQPPRLFLIAPSFSVTLLNRIKWLTISSAVSLFAYKCIALEDAPEEPLPVYVEVTAPALREPVASYSLESHLNYVTDLAVRAKAHEVLTAIQSFGQGVSLDIIKDGISIKVDGRVFAYGWPKRRYFTIEYLGTDEQWAYTEIDGDTDLEPLKASVQAAFARKRATT